MGARINTDDVVDAQGVVGLLGPALVSKTSRRSLSDERGIAVRVCQFGETCWQRLWAGQRATTGRVTARSTRGRPKGDTRERILDAALPLFEERGFDGTTVTAIEGAVGLSPGSGSFYRHFRSKEEVFVAAVEARVRRLVELARDERAGVREISDPVERQRLRVVGRLVEMNRFRALWSLVVAEHERFPELQGVFVTGLRWDRWDAGWKESRASAIAFAACVGYSQLAALGGGPFRDVTFDEFVDAIVEFTANEAPTS
jgi:AcrR family transcriptional regulator